MKRSRIAVAAGVLGIAFAVAAGAQTTTETSTTETKVVKVQTGGKGAHGAATAAAHKFVGVLKCKTCHNSPAKGAQFKIWSESKHAKAFATLASEDAKDIAKKKGIADAQKSADCLKCHVTGYGEAKTRFGPSFKEADGVQCESCHGAGSDYMSMTTMKATYAKTTEPVKVGLVMPDKETCVTCHNDQSPTFKSFDFSADSAKIAHPVKKP